jgi:hypothetical protein
MGMDTARIVTLSKVSFSKCFMGIPGSKEAERVGADSSSL